MDRRPSIPRAQRQIIPRILRRPFALLRRTLARDGLYIAISLTLLLLLTLFILALSTRAYHSAVVYPALLPFDTVKHRNPANSHAVAGTMRDLDHLLANVTNSTHVSDSRRDESVHDKLVVAIAVNYAFRQLALNFVCNLKRVAVSNYVILAMDRTVFDYLAARGANTFFYESSTKTTRRLLQHSHKFGSTAFVETSRRKSILVLKVLRLGYSVVFSDVDVVWVRDPIPELLRHDFDFVMQSDRSHKDQDTALNYNLNSGFYLVRSSIRSVTALKAIVKYAEAIRRSEQKAFNYVLCGAFKDHHAGPGIRVGAQKCTYRKGGATVIALPLEAFPNGSDESLWSNRSASFEEVHPGVVAVHANYIEGLAEKIERIKRIGYWLHSEDSRRPDECVLPTKR